MNKTEFLEQLERLLWDISCQEREEALDFYRSYFEDAGEENEAQVIQELGSPGKVAAIIKADLEDGREGTGEEHGEYTESGYQDERFREDHVPEKAQERTGNSESTENTEDSRRSQQGSYTNYLFDKGIDKILKKLGEEATEIVIAAKNPNPNEVKYEISDFLYHMMVLMAERGITWDDIMEEMAKR